MSFKLLGLTLKFPEFGGSRHLNLQTIEVDIQCDQIVGLKIRLENVDNL